jgi:hypothetical protein
MLVNKICSNWLRNSRCSRSVTTNTSRSKKCKETRDEQFYSETLNGIFHSLSIDVS